MCCVSQLIFPPLYPNNVLFRVSAFRFTHVSRMVYVSNLHSVRSEYRLSEISYLNIPHRFFFFVRIFAVWILRINSGRMDSVLPGLFIAEGYKSYGYRTYVILCG